MKKILLVLIIVLVAAGILYLGFLFRSQNTAPGPNPPGGGIPNVSSSGSGDNGGGNGTLPNPSFSGLATVFSAPVLDYFIDAQNSVIAVTPDGGVVKSSGDQAVTVSSSTISNLSRARFSADGKKLLVVFSGGQSIFDIEKGSWQPLPAGAKNPAWGPNGGILAYFANGTLSTLGTEAKNPKPKILTVLRDKDGELEWPSADTIFIKEPPTALAQSSVWAFSLKNSSLVPVIENQLGLDTKWSGDLPAVGILFTAKQNNQGGVFALVDQSGKETKSFSFLTLPSKCVFYESNPVISASSTNTSSSASTTKSSPPPASKPSSQQSLLCAIPRDRRPLDLNPLPDAYLKNALYTSDDIYSIDPADGTLKLVFNDKAKNIDASNLKVFGRTLYFVNRYDKKLYSLPLGN